MTTVDPLVWRKGIKRAAGTSLFKALARLQNFGAMSKNAVSARARLNSRWLLPGAGISEG